MDVEPILLLMGVAGGILSWFMANSMKAGLVLKIIIALVSIVACYFLSYLIANK